MLYKKNVHILHFVLACYMSLYLYPGYPSNVFVVYVMDMYVDSYHRFG